MGIVVVLIVYSIAMTIGASVGAVVLGIAAYALTKHSATGRKRAISASVTFPFLCVVWAGLWFGAYAVINYSVFERDPGLGDGWQTPLPNGYALMMIDTTDQGTVYNPKTQGGGGLVSSGDDAVFGVRQLQISGNLIFGARDSDYFHRIGQESKIVDAYFELDTEKKTHSDFQSIDDLRKRAAAEGVALNLRPFESVFGDYRATWFDYASGVILLAVPACGFFWLVRFVWTIRLSGAAPVRVAG